MNRRQFMKAGGLTALAAAFFGKISKLIAGPKVTAMDNPQPLEKGDMCGINGREGEYWVWDEKVPDGVIWKVFKRDAKGLYKCVGKTKSRNGLPESFMKEGGPWSIRAPIKC